MFNVLARYDYIKSLRGLPPLQTSLMKIREQAMGLEPGTYSVHRFEEMDTEGILAKCVLLREDPTFHKHSGFSFRGLRKALMLNWRRRSLIAGGSTITQQLAKNLFCSTDRTYMRKVKEGMYTLLLEATLEKPRLLTLYLNTIELGEGVWGCPAAADYYCGISYEQLGLLEAAFLTSRIPAPRREMTGDTLDWLLHCQVNILHSLYSDNQIDLGTFIQSVNCAGQLRDGLAQGKSPRKIFEALRFADASSGGRSAVVSADSGAPLRDSILHPHSS